MQREADIKKGNLLIRRKAVETHLFYEHGFSSAVGAVGCDAVLCVSLHTIGKMPVNKS